MMNFPVVAIVPRRLDTTAPISGTVCTIGMLAAVHYEAGGNVATLSPSWECSLVVRLHVMGADPPPAGWSLVAAPGRPWSRMASWRASRIEGRLTP